VLAFLSGFRAAAEPLTGQNPLHRGAEHNRTWPAAGLNLTWAQGYQNSLHVWHHWFHTPLVSLEMSALAGSMQIFCSNNKK